MEISTLIILYALAGTIEIPTGCFVAAWIWLICDIVILSISLDTIHIQNFG